MAIVAQIKDDLIDPEAIDEGLYGGLWLKPSGDILVANVYGLTGLMSLRHWGEQSSLYALQSALKFAIETRQLSIWISNLRVIDFQLSWFIDYNEE